MPKAIIECIVFDGIELKWEKMSIQNAINFFDAYTDDAKLRTYLGMLNSPDDVRDFLKEIDMDFYDEELEEAYNLLVLRCNDEADHNVLSQVKVSYIELISELETIEGDGKQ